MEQIGYSLINENNIEIQYWGDKIGQCAGFPSVVYLPDSNIINAPEINISYGNYKLVQRWVDNNPPSQFYSKIDEVISFDGEKIIVTYVYPSEPNVTPQVVSPLQMRLALNQMGLRTQIDDYVKTLDQNSQDSWEYATEILRTNPIIKNAAEALGKTDAEVDDLFRLASTLP